MENYMMHPLPSHHQSGGNGPCPPVPYVGRRAFGNTIFAPQQNIIYPSNQNMASQENVLVNPPHCETRQAGGKRFAPRQYAMDSDPYNYNVSSQNAMDVDPPPYQFQPSGGTTNIFVPQQNVINAQISPVQVVTTTSSVIVAQRVYKNYMALSIMTMLFCFWPVGIAALVFSCKTVDAQSEGDSAAEASNSRTAFKLNMVAIGLGCPLYAVWTVLGIFL